MIKTFNFYKDNFEAILYNICSIFFIITNLFIPFYSNEIIFFNSTIIEKITINYKIDNNNKKIIFLDFTNNLIKKNTDIITKMENDRIQNENISNYFQECDNINNEYSDDSWETD